MRIDKYLWAIRVFKTRSLASEACSSAKIFIDNQAVKPSRNVNIGDIIQVKKTPVTYSYKVLQLLDKRVGAKLVETYAIDITPKEEIEKLDLMKMNAQAVRDRGTGRPTKKDRRIIDKYFDE